MFVFNECDFGPRVPSKDNGDTVGVFATHPDDKAVLRFAEAMIQKLSAKRAQGYDGWGDEALCSSAKLNKMLNEHLEKGDPTDIGNLAMMLWNRGEATVRIPMDFAAIDAAKHKGFPMWLDAESWGIVVDGLILKESEASSRKAVNKESNSEFVANRCKEIIEGIEEKSSPLLEDSPN